MVCVSFIYGSAHPDVAKVAKGQPSRKRRTTNIKKGRRKEREGKNHETPRFLPAFAFHPSDRKRSSHADVKKIA